MTESIVEEVVPIGEVGDGTLQVRYTPEPAHNHCKFEIEWAWSPDHVDRVYVGDADHAIELIQAIAKLVQTDLNGSLRTTTNQ